MNILDSEKRSQAARGDAEDLLIEAAEKLFAQHGYDGVSVKDIAEGARVNVSLINYYFDGKEGLYRACLQRFGKQRLTFSERILIEPVSREDVRARLSLFIDEVLESYVQDPYAMRIVHRECENRSVLSHDIFRDTFVKVFENLKSFLQLAQQKQFLRADLNIHVVGMIFFGMLIHFTRTDDINKEYLGHSITDPAFRKEASKTLLDIFLNGTV